jgi:hypothetical protein
MDLYLGIRINMVYKLLGIRVNMDQVLQVMV